MLAFDPICLGLNNLKPIGHNPHNLNTTIIEAPKLSVTILFQCNVGGELAAQLIAW